MSTNKIYAECINSNGGGTEVSVVCGNPPKACRNFTCTFDDDNDVLKFTWEDVDNDFWGGCRLVVKRGSAPENAEDGEIIIDTYELDKYKVNPLEVPIEDSDTYYATLFPFNTSGIMNSLKVNHINLAVVNTRDPISFAEDSWDMIISVLNDTTRNASDYYHKGDTKQLTCLDGNTYTMKIDYVSNNYMNLVANELCEDTFSVTDNTMVDYTINDKGYLYHDDTLLSEDPVDLTCNIKYTNINDLVDQLQDLLNILPENIRSNVLAQNTGDMTIKLYTMTSFSDITGKDYIFTSYDSIENIDSFKVNTSCKIIPYNYSSSSSIVNKKIIGTDNNGLYLIRYNNSIGSVTAGAGPLDELTKVSDTKYISNLYVNEIQCGKKTSSYVEEVSNVVSCYEESISINDIHKLLYFRIGK